MRLRRARPSALLSGLVALFAGVAAFGLIAGRIGDQPVDVGDVRGGIKRNVAIRSGCVTLVKKRARFRR